VIAVANPSLLSLARSSAWRWPASTLLLFAAVGCTPAQVLSFHVEPPNICAGERVTVTWDVRGKAALNARPIPNGWDVGKVPSSGSRTVAVDSTTTFAVVAVEANPAEGHRRGEGQVLVVSPSSTQMAASAACDSSGQTYVGTFSFGAASARLRVANIESPTLVKSGASTARQVCASHLGQTVCVEPGGVMKMDALAAGAWTLSSKLSAGETCTPPPQLRVKFAFSCR
jgi:hypothetical protein